MKNKSFHNLRKTSIIVVKVILSLITLLFIIYIFFGGHFSKNLDSSYRHQFEPFKLYLEFINGNIEIQQDFLENFVVLIPIGNLLTAIMYGTSLNEKKKVLIVIGISLFLSMLKIVLLYFLLGTLEFEDLPNNLLGGCIGYVLFRLFQFIMDGVWKRSDGQYVSRRILYGLFCILMGLLCIITGKDYYENSIDLSDETLYDNRIDTLKSSSSSFISPENPVNSNSKYDSDSVFKISDNINSAITENNNLFVGEITIWDYVFQLDSIETIQNSLVLKGFTFILDKNYDFYSNNKPQIMLKPDGSSKLIALDTEYGNNRQDVNHYFLCEYDYSKSGFSASIPLSQIDINEEYEVYIQFGNFDASSTYSFIDGTGINYAPRNSFVAPITDSTDLDIIVKEGKLRAYRPDQFCWIYQYNNCLYWIADDGFTFENNGHTFIEYHINTTQTTKLPDTRLENSWYWDNIGANFEDYEITNNVNCGKYRVMRRKLPLNYSITTIWTGYYINKEWIWRQPFWPYYNFEES